MDQASCFTPLKSTLFANFESSIVKSRMKAPRIINCITQIIIYSFSGILFYGALFSLAQGATKDKQKGNGKTYFEKVPCEVTNVTFSNPIVEDSTHNFLNYTYLFNGGGVAIGDINNDGLPDLYFTANQESNRLYLNRGNFEFDDITQKAKVEGDNGWTNGVVMVDINNDGFLDIYVCRSGRYGDPNRRKNLLFINQGDLTFSEEGEAYGLDDDGYSVQAYFLDFDKDQDLDMYLINHPIDFSQSNTVYSRTKENFTIYESDKLYKNDGNNTFVDATFNAGIANSAWGLSAAIGDFNSDGWDDIYVANDYIEPDYLYINNRDGTFRERIRKFMKHIPYYSMGSDYADVNNDGLFDLVVLDMVPEDHVRAKRLMKPMSRENFWKLVDMGFHYQYMLNVLQLNRGNGDFSEIGQLAGIAKTDWSWAVLLADWDNDGEKDAFITNGIKKDITDNDFYLILKGEKELGHNRLDYNSLMALMPSTRLQNYAFRNSGNLTFENVSDTWNLVDKVNSNGAAYADLDSDGDLELVINNLDSPAIIYRNMTRERTEKHFLTIQLIGSPKNRLGIGSRVRLTAGDRRQVQRFAMGRGYLSSVENKIHFGLGDSQHVDQILVEWPDGRISRLENVNVDRTITIDYKSSDVRATKKDRFIDDTLFTEVTDNQGGLFRHQEDFYDDFQHEVLLPHRQSQHGPLVSVGDVNDDGLDDFFVGGAAGFPGVLFLQTQNGTFDVSKNQPWTDDRECEDLGSLFVDVDNDNDLDLYVVSGGTSFNDSEERYMDRLYLNQNNRGFVKSEGALPKMQSSGLRVVGGDYDRDGDVDLFVGGRILPGRYPNAPRSYLLENAGGKFNDVTEAVAPNLVRLGLTTDALFTDYDNDGDLDLLVVGEWMPISVFENHNGQFTNVTDKSGLEHTHGWWFSVTQGDYDKDGDLDFIAGNIGKNNKFHPTKENPLRVIAGDFDESGTFDIVLAKSYGGKVLPIRGRECSSVQIPFISQKFPTYKAFAEASLSDIYPAAKLKHALQLQAQMFSSCLVINEGNGQFRTEELPIEAQFSAIMGMVSLDVNGDGNLDVIMTGNMHGAEVETVRYDAGFGCCLLGEGNGTFRALSLQSGGFHTPGDARDLKTIQLKKEKHLGLLVANNNSELQMFKKK